MGTDDRRNRIREADLLHDLSAHDGVGFHLLELVRSKFAGLRDDVFGDREFADVVQQSGGAESFELALAQSQFFADGDGVDFDSFEMVVGGLVFCLYGERKHFDRSAMERGDFFGVGALLIGTFFFIFQAAHIQAVRAIDDVENRQQQERRLPAEQLAGGVDDPGDGGADQVVGERPEI